MKNWFARLLLALCGALLSASTLSAQSAAPLRGQVVDERGAVVPGARVTLIAADSKKRGAVTNAQGEFTIPNVAPGTYTLTVEFKGFQTHVENDLRWPADTSPLKITLTVAPVNIETNITDESAGVSVEPDQNLSAIVLDEKMIMEMLPDNEDDLRDFLLALAGPAAGGAQGGQGEAQFYIDGFPGGRLPPREAILRIRINQSPFTAEYAHPGVGRIEIITKPGTEQWHSSVGFSLRNAALDARSANATTKPAFDSQRYSFTLSGPIIPKKMSFFFNGENRTVDSANTINAITLNGPFITNVPSLNENRSFGLRTGYLINKKNTLNFGYNYHQSHRESNGGDNGFTLPDRGSINDNTNQTLMISETFLINSRLIHETRARLQHEVSSATAKTPGVAINVLDAFQSGGNTCCPNATRQNQLDFQDYLTFTYKKHTLKGGFQLEYDNNRDLAATNFNGTYTFSSLDQYRHVTGGDLVPVNPLDPNSPLTPARPTQFTVNRGDPLLRYSEYQASFFLQEDFRLSQSLTVSAGLRYEFQAHLPDKLNFAPRFAIAWSPSKDRKMVIRTGGGLFFNRLSGGLYENTLRYDGVTQQSLVIRNPLFCPQFPNNLASCDPIAGNQQVEVRNSIKRVLDPNLQAPYTIFTQSSIERQLPRGLTGSFTYIYSRGVHFFRTRNINAPKPCTNDDPNHIDPFCVGGLRRPNPAEGNLYQLESSATSRFNGLMFRLDRRFGRSFSVFGNYTLSWTNSDADGPQTLPADNYNLRPEWGRAFTDRRHHLNIMGVVTLPHGFRLSPFVLVTSGAPFNITTGTDDNRDSAINDRPAGINRNSDLLASLYSLIPDRCLRNCGVGQTPVFLREFLLTNFPNGVSAVGAGSFNFNLSVTKTFGFGHRNGQLSQNRPAGDQTGPGQGPGGDSAPGGDQAEGPGPDTQGPGGGRGGQGGQGGQGDRGGRAGGGGGGGFGGGRGGFGGGGFGGRGGGGRGGGRNGNNNEVSSRFNLSLSAQITNLLNHVNPGPFTGALTSPFFDRSNRVGPARHVEFNLRFSF